MLEIKFVKNNQNEVIERLKIRNLDATKIIEDLLELYEIKNIVQANMEKEIKELKKINAEIFINYKEKSIEQTKKLKSQAKDLKLLIKYLKEDLEWYSELTHKKLLKIPNLPHISVPNSYNKNTVKILI